MVWAEFSLAGGRSELIVMERDPKASHQGCSACSYIKELEEELPRMYMLGFILQHDNASIHQADTTWEWLVNWEFKC